MNVVERVIEALLLIEVQVFAAPPHLRGGEAEPFVKHRREAQRDAEPGDRLLMFDAILDSPVLRLTALLALDSDPDYEPLPFLDATRRRYREMVDEGTLPVDLDVEALHVLSIATSIAAAIYLEPAARQLDVPADELRKLLAIKDEPTFEATATTGAGVFETLKGIAREVLLDLRKRRTPGSLRPASAAR